MADTHDVVVIVGSLRKDSLNRKAAHAIAAMAPASLRFEIVEIGQLPFYDQDRDGSPPAAWTAFRERVFGANHHLRQSLVHLDMPTLPQPEAYIGSARALFDDNGAITNDDRRKLLQKFVAAFAAWIEKH